MPNDEGLRQCKCGKYVLVKDMVEVDTADTSELPYMDRVPDEQLPECIAQAGRDEIEVAARLGYWRYLNHPYRERYRQHRDAEEATTRAAWETANPDRRNWWDKLRGRKSPVYSRPPGSPFTYEDPNHRIDERTEILADGTLLPLQPFRSPFPEPRRLCERIVSGGQTGADRGALDFAIKHGYIHGGWAPHGRLAEDGVIPAKYQLTEMAEGGYRQRTRRNVVDSDATLIVNLGELDGGTLATQVFAEKSGKPCLVVQADPGISEGMVDSVIAWLRQHDVKILNVAGPRESKRPGICRLTSEMLTAVDAVLQSK